jgi:pimeloyl-ACP methyl ester carboxylesterase
MQIQNLSFTLSSPHGNRPIAADASFIPGGQPKPVILFIHGFKGFKDWGTFPLIAGEFAGRGFLFIKLNLSHNGTTPEQPDYFADLEAFGRNTFSIELDDIGTAIDALFTDRLPELKPEADLGQVFLVGHSRGGGLAILKAREDQRVRKVVTWAAVADFQNLWRGIAEEGWRKNGVVYIANSRTKQQMPLYFQVFEDYALHQNRLNIREAAGQLSVPLMVIHGDADETVPVESASELAGLNQKASLHLVPGGGHTFGGTHPFSGEDLPSATQEVLNHTIAFLQKTQH